VNRPLRINGILGALCLLSGALALPLGAEEITVTVPPDAPAQSAAKPAAALPSFTGGSNLKPVAADNSATDQGSSDAAAAPAPPDATKHKKKPAAAAKPKPAADAAADSSSAPAAATPSGAAAPATSDKPKAVAKVSPCKGLDENTCGGNKLCSWVAPAPDAAGKVASARCRSLAALKKEAKKTAKAGTSEVLPWARKTSAATPDAAGTGTAAAASADASAKPKKTKTASAKKPSKPKTEAVPAAADSTGGQDAPASAAPPATADPN
jgi:hypothetical protein